jgi:hypothetical protein
MSFAAAGRSFATGVAAGRVLLWDLPRALDGR